VCWPGTSGRLSPPNGERCSHAERLEEPAGPAGTAEQARKLVWTVTGGVFGKGAEDRGELLSGEINWQRILWKGILGQS
jgi:hypothetical protein